VIRVSIAPYLLVVVALAVPGAAAQAATVRHRHHRARHVSRVHLQAAPQQVAARPDPNALAPAPVPNLDVSAPDPPLPPDTASVVPGNLQLHFPSLGNGFLPGSSSSDVSNIDQPNVPGVNIVVPLSTPKPAGNADQPAP
jgi:hypothetical protein